MFRRAKRADFRGFEYPFWRNQGLDNIPLDNIQDAGRTTVPDPGLSIIFHLITSRLPQIQSVVSGLSIMALLGGLIN